MYNKRKIKRFSAVAAPWLFGLALAIWGEFHHEIWQPANTIGVACAAFMWGMAAGIWIMDAT